MDLNILNVVSHGIIFFKGLAVRSDRLLIF